MCLIVQHQVGTTDDGCSQHADTEKLDNWLGERCQEQELQAEPFHEARCSVESLLLDLLGLKGLNGLNVLQRLEQDLVETSRAFEYAVGDALDAAGHHVQQETADGSNHHAHQQQSPADHGSSRQAADQLQRLTDSSPKGIHQTDR